MFQKLKINLIIDIAATLSFIVVVISGIALEAAPGGARSGVIQEFWGITRRDWSVLHEFAGIILVILILFHILLHWKWIACSLRNLFSEKGCKTVDTVN